MDANLLKKSGYAAALTLGLILSPALAFSQEAEAPAKEVTTEDTTGGEVSDPVDSGEVVVKDEGTPPDETVVLDAGGGDVPSDCTDCELPMMTDNPEIYQSGVGGPEVQRTVDVVVEPKAPSKTALQSSSSGSSSSAIETRRKPKKFLFGKNSFFSDWLKN